MKRQTRPFTVEIKSSRKPVQKADPASAAIPGTTSSPASIWAGNHLDSSRDRDPSSLSALHEANRIFAKLITPAPVLEQSSDPLPSDKASDGGEYHSATITQPKGEPPRAAQVAS